MVSHYWYGRRAAASAKGRRRGSPRSYGPTPTLIPGHRSAASLPVASLMPLYSDLIPALKARPAYLLLHLQKQHRNINTVANLIGRAPVKKITDESMAVSRHCDQLDRLCSGQFDDLSRRFPHRQDRAYFKS